MMSQVEINSFVGLGSLALSMLTFLVVIFKLHKSSNKEVEAEFATREVQREKDIVARDLQRERDHAEAEKWRTEQKAVDEARHRDNQTALQQLGTTINT